MIRALYDVCKLIVGVALRWYYRSLTIANADRIPREGPIFLAANHPNSLTDAMVVGWVSPRRVRFTAKATLFGNAIASRLLRSFGVIPLRRAADERAAVASATDAVPDASRNAGAFDAVADALAAHACVVVFPEGKTHDEPYMAPVRTGLARMALMARDERGVRGIRIVPLGLLFERKEEPRSRILLQVGDIIAVDDIPAGPSAVTSLTELVDSRLRAVTLNFESRADAERVQLLGETLAALVEPTTSVTDGAAPLASTLAIVRRVSRAQQILQSRHEPDIGSRIEEFERRLRAFRDRLRAERLNVHDVGIDITTSLGVRFVVREALIASVMLPVSLWGRLTHVLPLRLARVLALRNVQALDEPPMRTFVIGLLLVLATYAVYIALVAFWLGGWWALAFFATLIPSASSDLRYADRLQRLRQRARAYRKFRADPALQPTLMADADFLRAEAGALEQLSLA